MLPLFPLNVVLFPKSALSLHIFEERYKTLIGECLNKRGMEFGINFVDGENLSPVGCTAVVKETVQRYEDGRLDIIVEGQRRYELRQIDETVAPYVVGHVAFLHDEPAQIDKLLLEKTIDLYNQIVQVVYKGSLPKLSADSGRHDVSFVMAQKAGMDLRQRQDLLETTSENKRLQKLHEYLAGVIPMLQHVNEVQRIVNNDGYIIN